MLQNTQVSLGEMIQLLEEVCHRPLQACDCQADPGNLRTRLEGYINGTRVANLQMLCGKGQKDPITLSNLQHARVCLLDSTKMSPQFRNLKTLPHAVPHQRVPQMFVKMYPGFRFQKQTIPWNLWGTCDKKFHYVFHALCLPKDNGTPMETSPLLSETAVLGTAAAEVITGDSAVKPVTVPSSDVSSDTSTVKDAASTLGTAQLSNAAPGVASDKVSAGEPALAGDPVTMDTDPAPVGVSVTDVSSSNEPVTSQTATSEKADSDLISETACVNSSCTADSNTQVTGGGGKRPKSPQASSSTESAATSSSNVTVSTCQEGVDVSDSLQNLCLCTPDQAQGENEASASPRPESAGIKKEGSSAKRGQSAKGSRKSQRSEEMSQGADKEGSDAKFEPYWPAEQLSEGLKRGTIFEGRIRINPKNYEDAYVPLPDGSSDIYLPGMTCRNRALNGDIVAIQIGDRDNWRVYSSELDHYEQQNTPAPVKETGNEESETPEADQPDVTPGAAGMDLDEKANKKEDEDGPDVVIEEEEVVELDKSGNPISTKVTKPSPADSVPAQPDKGSQPKQGGHSERGKDSPSSSRNRGRYMSVKEVMDKGSPVARQLFAAKGAGTTGKESHGVNMDKYMQKTGKVVAIIEKKHSRACSGRLRPMQDNNPNCAIFSPTDSRVPRIVIPSSDLPPGFQERPGDFASVLFIARILDWNDTMKMPKGTLARSLGEAGEIDPQTEALLIENDVDDSEFSEQVLQCLPQELPWSIPASEFEYRRDFRKECVFTIDPSTARDLDDALSCRSLGDGVYEVGVHIADVSYFVTEGTKLDDVAQSRATSVYLVQKVIPMLPRLLCEQLCSLNPDEDRLTFSVVWKMTEDGEILDEWFGRSVIRSCVKLSYDHAQGFIDEPERIWTPDELPPISEGFCVEDIKSRVLIMNKMAKAMRQARFDSGALRLDQLKIQFTLDKESGLPNGYFVYQQRDSNKLVEEFMLLANMAVAHKIKTSFQSKALLRRHPPPQSRMIDELKETCASLGFPMEVDTAKDIQRSLQRYTGEDELSKARMQVLVVLCSKPMQNAKYFCCGVLADEALYHHYALNVPLYTHFTSPIRRYPDILVHRTLAAALGYCDVTKRSSQEIHVIAEYCNDKKTNAKRASELSNEIFFSTFVKEAGPLEEKGMVMNVLDKSFDVYVLTLGVVKRVYCERLPLERFSHHKEGKRPELTLVWNPDDGCPHSVTQKISIFSSVNCVLKSDEEPLKWSVSTAKT
ncbi:hypothetical protein BaRGS_00027325 [Batillaria attramentaria]|uniref:DIS3-like exonuclease 2 n=1 Tax=Batillaria attramentaria TaxID=370345 RepID=A0ABD0K2B4_9CAEN